MEKLLRDIVNTLNQTPIDTYKIVSRINAILEDFDNDKIFFVLNINKSDVDPVVIKWFEQYEPYTYMDTHELREHLYSDNVLEVVQADYSDFTKEWSTKDGEVIPGIVINFIDKMFEVLKENDACYYRII